MSSIPLQFTVGWLDSKDVHTPEQFAEYVQQIMGSPYPTGKQMATLKRQIKACFAANPKADMMSLCKTVDWCKAHSKRLANAYSVVSFVRYAWRDGYLPELDRDSDKTIDAAIDEALRRETRTEWRQRLMRATSLDGKVQCLEEWKQSLDD